MRPGSRSFAASFTEMRGPGFDGHFAGFWWRVCIMIGVAIIVGAILLMAYLLRNKVEQNQAALADIIRQLNQAGMPLSRSAQAMDVTGDRLIFFLRWGALGAMGLITLALVWMLG